MIGPVNDINEAIKLAQNDPHLHDHFAAANVQMVPNIVDGKFSGMIAAYVTPDFLNSPTTIDIPLTFPVTKDGKTTDVTVTIPQKQAKWGKVIPLMTSIGKDSTDLALKQQQQASEAGLRTSQGAEARAGAAQKGAEAGMTQLEADYLKEHGFLPGKFSETAGSKEADVQEWGPGGYTQGFKPWNKEVIEPAQATEGSFQAADTAYKEFKAAQAKGQRLTTGAQSMQMLSQHIATTFGKVKGNRLNKDMIQAHLHARSISDEMEVAVNKLYNGGELSASQWDAFHDLISQSREQSWKSVIDSANLLDKPKDKVQRIVPVDMWAKYGPKPAPGGAAGGGGAGAAPGAGGGAGGGGAVQPTVQLPEAALNLLKLMAGKPTELFKNGVSQGKWQINQAGEAVKVSQ
jgi:hypothetical protein